MTKKENNSCVISFDAILESVLDDYILTASIGNETHIVGKAPKKRLKVVKPPAPRKPR